MWCVRFCRRVLLGIAFLAAAPACQPGTGPAMRFMVSTPHEQYEARLRQIGLQHTALGQDWLAAAQRALIAPLEVEVPHREARYLDPARATAVGYRLPVQRGQRVVVRVNAAHALPRRFRLFLDLYFRPGGEDAPPRLVASADSLAWELEYVAYRSGQYLLRVQPELLRGGRVTLMVSVGGTLGFPVAGRDLRAVRSRFGARRDAGRRRHEGVDIFAPRGTPVLASVAGRVSRVTTTPVGGRVVWLQDSTFGRSLYYAHLDRQAVRPGTWVHPGDTLGFIGNTGNARTTAPHLHFGIYLAGTGPVDPFYQLYDPRREPPETVDDAGVVPRWVRVTGRGVVMRRLPDPRTQAVAYVAAGTPIEVIAGTGRWYFARLPSGHEGYLDRSFTEALAPVAVKRLAAATPLRGSPGDGGELIDSLGPGRAVSVLGGFRNYVLVRDVAGLQGWLDAAALPAVAPLAPRPSLASVATGRSHALTADR